jgi:hypothetical protein
MTPKEFVALFYNHKIYYFNECLNENSGLDVSSKIKSLNLNEEQKQIMKEVVDGILTDVYYSILLGLDGCTNTGGVQTDYKIYDEDRNLITDGGEIEEYAWEFFQDRKE